MSYSAFRNHLAACLDEVNDVHKPSLITSQNVKPTIVLNVEAFHTYEETAYLIITPLNVKRLNQAI